MEIINMPPVGMFGTNSYIVCSDDGKAALIDAPGNTSEVLSVLAERGLSLEYILLTHGHCDHIFSLADTAEQTGARVMIHELDAGKLTDPHYNLTEFFGLAPVREYRRAETLTDGDTISFGNVTVKVMHTPGHTSGSVMFIAEDSIFSGDTLFEGSIGRTDMPDGDTGTLRRSLKKIAAFSGEYEDHTVYPGHGNITSLNSEKRSNPYLSL